MAEKPDFDPDLDYINICGGDRDLPPKKRPRDVNQLAKMIVDLSTGDETESEVTTAEICGAMKMQTPPPRNSSHADRVPRKRRSC